MTEDSIPTGAQKVQPQLPQQPKHTVIFD